MARTTITGYQRQYGSNGKGASPSVGLQCLQFTFDAARTTAGTGQYLPKGCIPVFSQVIDTSVTGGTAPTIEIGTAGAGGFNNGFATVVPATAKTGLISAATATTGGAQLGEEITRDREIFAGAGDTGTAGTGNVTCAVYYIMIDDGSP